MSFDAGYSKTPLTRKLGCKPDRPVVLIGAPVGFAAYLVEQGFEAIEVHGAADVPEGAGHVHLFSTRAAVIRATGRSDDSWHAACSGPV